MGFRSFRTNIIIRILFIGLALFFFAVLLTKDDKLVSLVILGIIILVQLYELFKYVENTNRKLTRFLESVKYSDFSTGFSTDNKLGKSFKDLNKAFNEVLDAFRETRKEKEEHLNYLNTVVQHISTGVLSFDPDGKVELINNTARKFLQAYNFRNIAELKPQNPTLFKILIELPPGQKTLIRLSSDLHLAIQATQLIMRGKALKLLALQNIQSELQQKEIEAWQNLTRVLRHEIMNSITPIASLTGTLNEILKEDIKKVNSMYEIEPESIDDISDGLRTIESRSKALIKFVDAYRDYTNIPQPKFITIVVKELFEHVHKLMKTDLTTAKVFFACKIDVEDLQITADIDLIEMVLINLLKNAKEAVEQSEEPKIELRARLDEDLRVLIEVKDNGPGIIPDALDRIFIPFYTTKKTGSGIGLALSRQIMQMHNGSLTVKSEPNLYTIFALRF